MRKKILVELTIILYFIAIIIPVIGISENKPKDFLKYINGDTSKDQSRYTKIYNNVFIFGIGNNQKDVDEKYKVGEKWIIEGREYDLVIAPYSGNSFIDSLLASSEHAGIPVVSEKAFASYKGALFRNVETHSGGGLAFRNQVEYGTIDYEQATLYAYPRSFSEDVDQRDTYVINKGDPIPYLPVIKFDAKEGGPGAKFGWTIHFGPGRSIIEKGPGTGHYLNEYLKRHYVTSPASSLPTITPAPIFTDTPYPPPTNTPPPWDDGNGGGGGLGGVDFTDININHISSNISVEQINKFGYTFKTKKANNGDKIINIEDMAELSLSSFFVGLTIPKSDFWVNLNLWEPDRIIENDLGTTDIGRIMLESDLRMKKNFGKYEDPCMGDIGTEYWELLEKKREELITNIMKKYPNDIKDIKNVQFVPVTRHWIVPDKIDAYETDDEIYIINATMSISSEPVYDHSEYQIINQNTFFISKSSKDELEDASKEYGRYVKELEEKMILPLVVQDINKNYSELMRVYTSLALAQWYKDKYRYSNSPFIDFIDSNNLNGLQSKSTWDAKNIWKDYKKSFEEGDYNCWKNETFLQGDYTVTSNRLYIGGGVDFTNIKITNKGDVPENLKELISDAKSSSFAKTGDDHYFGDELYFVKNGNNDSINGVKDEISNDVNNEIKYDKEKLSQEDQKVSGFTVILGILAILIINRIRR